MLFLNSLPTHVKEFMQNIGVWGEDLTNYAGFSEKVAEIIENL